MHPTGRKGAFPMLKLKRISFSEITYFLVGTTTWGMSVTSGFCCCCCCWQETKAAATRARIAIFFIIILLCLGLFYNNAGRNYPAFRRGIYHEKEKLQA